MRTSKDLEGSLNIVKVAKKDTGMHRRVELLWRGTWDKRM